MMPGDFKLRSRYGVGMDWPISYDDLEAHYGVAEQIMLVSGPSDSPMPRSRAAPLVPHRFSDPDVLLKKRFPEGMDYESAAAFVLSYGTSDHALRDRGSLRAGETLLVLGAAGGVGLAAIEIGKALGARVIACA